MSEILHGCLPDTEYFEVTAQSGHRYAIWVTTPPGYSEFTEPLPLIYVVDGNWAVGLTAPLIVTQSDPFLSVAPYIQVSVGYAGEEAADWAQVRNRNLVPPGERVSDEMVVTVTAARQAGKLTDEQADAYLEKLEDTHADVFLEFLTAELHPRLQVAVPGQQGRTRPLRLLVRRPVRALRLAVFRRSVRDVRRWHTRHRHPR